MKLIASLASILALAACGDDATVKPDAGAPSTFTARIRGPLAQSVDDSKAYHDQVAAKSEAAANAAGDFAHQVGLGTTDFGTLENEFLALDQWTDANGATQFYASPDFQAGLDPLLSVPPDVQLFERHPEWTSWGEMGSGRLSSQPYWFVTIQGRLVDPDVAANQAKHDAIAGAAEAMARAAGDLAHLPHLAIGDDRVFFNVDVWSSEQSLVATFSDPNFRAGLLSLFESPPDVRVYASTDWHQWYQP